MIIDVSLNMFKIHEHGEFTFGPGINAIIGPGGCGKTSIMEAIGWTAFGTLPGKKGDFLPVSCSTLSNNSVILSMTFDHHFVEVHKSLGGYSDLRLDSRKIAEGEMIVRETLADILGYNKMAFLFANLLGITQGSLDSVFSRSAAERVKVFSKCLGIDKYRDFSDWLLKSAGSLKDDVVSLKATLSHLVNDTEMFSAKKSDLESGISELFDHIEAEVLRNSSLRRDHDKIRSLEDAIVTLTAKAKSSTDLAESMREIEDVISSIEASICPICGASIDNPDSLLEKYSNRYKEYIGHRENALELTKGASLVKSRLGMIDTHKVQSCYIASNIKLSDLESERSALKSELNILNELLPDSKSGEITDAEAELARIKLAISKLDAIRTAGRRLPALIAVDVTTAVSELATEFVGLIYQDWTITWNEDFSIDVLKGDVELSFAQLSKSQKGIASLSVVLALAKVISPVDFILLDEPFSNMDADQVTAVAGAIRSIGWFRQVILTTHRSEIEHIFDNVIEVEA